MNKSNLLVITNNFPDIDNTHIGNIFVKEQIKYLKNYFNEVYVISPLAYGVGHLRKVINDDYEYDNVKVYFPKYFNFPLFYYYFRNLWVYLQKKAILNLIYEKNLKFDLIHAHFSWPSGVVATELKKDLKVPVVITHHARPLTLESEVTSKNKLFLKMWNSCDAIIRIKKGNLDLFSRIGVDTNKIYYIPDGYDHDKLPTMDKKYCRNKLNLPLDKKILLSVSTLTEIKGHKYSIEAIKYILNTRKDIIYVIGGSGPLESKLKKQIEELELGDYVKLIGFISNEDLAYWLNACDLFVFPSLGEGFGIAQLEALACGKPVVTTYNGGSEEIIISEDYGLLCEPANSQNLANNLIAALDKDWDEVKVMKYAKDFGWSAIARKIIEVYNKLIPKPILFSHQEEFSGLTS